MKKNKSGQVGQGMVEFALTIPVFLAVIFGIIEFSRYFLIQSAVFTASREATRYGSSVGTDALPNFKNCEQIAATAVRMGSFGGVETDDVTIYYESSPGVWAANCDPAVDPDDRYDPVLGDRVVVEIETDFVSLLGIIPNFTIENTNARTIMFAINGDVVLMTETTAAGANPTATQTTATATSPIPTDIPTATATLESPAPTATATLALPATATPVVTPVTCPVDPVEFVVASFPNSNTVRLTLKNVSEYAYKVSEISAINYSKGSLISVENKPPAGNLPDQSVANLNLQISAGSTVNIDFVFQNKHHENLSAVFHFDMLGQPGSACEADLDYP